MQSRCERMSAEVLVIGAGPAGSAAAMTLARRGVDVLLVDRAPFPRDKVCGDALIPDALAALSCLGLHEQVMARARRLSGMQIHAPNGRTVLLEGDCAVIPRQVLDEMLRSAAVRSGARFVAPYRAIAPVIRESRYCGAMFRHSVDREDLHVNAPWTILATGGAGDVLRAFGVASRVEPSAAAARMYIRVPSSVASRVPYLIISFGRQISPGYGWVFPGLDGFFNVGVGVFHDVTRRVRERNLRTIMNRFVDSFEPASTIFRAATSRSQLAGAPLRTALTGADLSRPGLLVAGEAAGATYSFSGEGIGKALQTGMLAASMIHRALTARANLQAVAVDYARAVDTEFRDRYRAYKFAQECLAYPAVGNVLAWRANAGSFVRDQLQGLFNETTDPRQLFSLSGAAKALLY